METRVSIYEKELDEALVEIDTEVKNDWTPLDNFLWYLDQMKSEQVYRELNSLLQKEQFEVIKYYDLAQDVLFMSHNRGFMNLKERYLAEHFIAYCHIQSLQLK